MPPRSGTGQTAWSRFKEALGSNENFEYVYWIQVGFTCILDWFIRILGPILVVFATGLIGIVVFLFLTFILPAAIPNLVFFDHQQRLHGLRVVSEFWGLVFYLSRIPNLLWCVFCATNIYFNYLACVFTKPGTTGDVRENENEYEMVRSSLESSHDIEEENESILQCGRKGTGSISGRAMQQQKIGTVRRRNPPVLNRQAGFCKKCQDIKPVRAHHCHICDRCILNMDHHCPWVNNCVGYYNHRYFILFMVYLWAGCFYAALVTLPQFIQSCKGRKVIVSFFMPISLELSRQTAITTIEFYENQNCRIIARNRGELFSNPFNGGWRKNWAQVFGDGPILLTILYSPSLRKPPPPIVSFFEGATQIPNQDLMTADSLDDAAAFLV